MMVAWPNAATGQRLIELHFAPWFRLFPLSQPALVHLARLKSECRHGAWNPANVRGPGAGRPCRRTRHRQRSIAAPELGLWINHTGKGAIDVYLCGSNLCGKIVWLKEPNNDAGRPKRDANNPDPTSATGPSAAFTRLRT